MREILFRGKRIDNGEWVEGFYCQRKEKILGGIKTRHMILVPDADSYSGARWIDVNPTTIGQCTGWTDKNGKKIYEGDIYTWKDDYGDYHACTICFGEYFDGYADRRATMANGFYVKTMQGETYNFAGLGYSEIEISGNIHDNPELLEDKS